MQSRGRALLTGMAAAGAIAAAHAQSPAPTITNAQASVTATGHALNGTFAYTRVGDLTVWGPGGGFIDIQSERGDAFQYSPFAKPGKYKTTVSQPLLVQVGVGPSVKVAASAGGECTLTIARADDTGVAGSFECGRIAVLGPEKKVLGSLDSMRGFFTASR
jgi:hypothetical protein